MPQPSPAPGVDSRFRAGLRSHADVGFVLFAALLVTLPLLLRGNSCGHDQIFHLISWLEAANQWSHGTLRPFWAFHPAWHAGEPRFVFYPPLSWTLGALLGFVLPWTAALTAYTFTTALLCGLAMRALLRRFTTAMLATAGACVYVANPYLLFVVYERAAYAELLAAAWMPLLLLCVLERRLQPSRLALAVALLWLTNAPAAIVGSYALLLLAIVRLFYIALRRAEPTWRRHIVMEGTQLTAGYLLGLGLAAFFLVPALVERRFVQLAMAVIPGMRPRDSFLFEHTGQDFHDAVLRAASWIAVAVLAVALASAAALLLRHKHHHTWRSMKARAVDRNSTSAAVVPSLAILSAVVLFLLTPLSAAVWTHAPQLAFLQFPWRFLTVEAAVAVVLLVLLAASFHLHGRSALAVALVFAATMPWLGNHTYRQACDDEDAPPARVLAFQADRGIDPTDEYTPVNDDNDTLQQDLPAAWLAENADGAPRAASSPDVVSTSDGNPGHLRFDVRAHAEPRTLIVRLRAYPSWQLLLDGTPHTTTSTRDDGLVTIDLPPNTAHAVQLRYRWAADDYAGCALSVACLLLLLYRWKPLPVEST